MRTLPLFAAALIVSSAVPAMAHTGQVEHGLIAGLTHPITGLDHLVAAVAVGVLATQIGRRATWLLPLVFLVGIAIGGTAGQFALPLPGVEWGIAVSLLAVGVAIVKKTAGPLTVTAIATACFAVFHGHAHLAEYDAATGVTGYVVGLFLATAALHAAGVGVAAGLKQTGEAQLVRVLGVAVLGFGLLKLAGVA